MKKPVPGCLWAHRKLLVGLRKESAAGLPPALVADLSAAGVDCVVNLLSRDQFREAGADALFGPMGDLSSASATTRHKINFAYVFWPETDTVPTARQVRQTLDEIDEAHVVGLTVFLYGAGIPSRAVMTAGCWLARNGCGETTDADSGSARLGWLEDGLGSARQAKWTMSLNDAQRAFVRDWPAGRNAEPVLSATELLDETEPYPTATVQYWLRTLATVRVYPEGRDGRSFEVPVKDEKRVSNGSIKLELYDFHSGTWIGERTLRLLDGTVVVFISPFKKSSR
jgi:hypothetical protein